MKYALFFLVLPGAFAVSVAITLVDGTRLSGELIHPNLSVMASFGEIAVPVKELARIERRGKSDLVHFQNGDRITVTLSSEQLGLRTRFGDVAIAGDKITNLVVRDSRALPPHLAQALVVDLPLDTAQPQDRGPHEILAVPFATALHPEGKRHGAYLFDGVQSAVSMRTTKLDLAGSTTIAAWARMDGPTENS